jgi:predicted peptidase
MNNHRTYIQRLGLALAVAFLFVTPCFAQQAATFAARVYTNAQGETMPYRLFIPRDYDQRKKYPLVLWLHGSPARGNDNIKQVSGTQTKGTQVWIRPEYQSKYPSIVLVPQCPEHKTWAAEVGSEQLTDELRLVLEIISQLQMEFSLDPQRFYVAGQSMGGIGVWQLITKYPNMFAAAVILCGKGDPSKAPLIAELPVWVFHGENDANPSTPVSEARKMVAAIRSARGHPKYTEYSSAAMLMVQVPNVPVGHNVWDKAFDEPDLVSWVFAHKRGSRGNR